MNKEELFKFISKFNKSKPIEYSTILEGLKTLNSSEQELFMLLVNYKNGNDFTKKQTDGEI